MADEEGVADKEAVVNVAVAVAAVAVVLMLLVGTGVWLMASSIKDLDGLSLVDRLCGQRSATDILGRGGVRVTMGW